MEGKGTYIENANFQNCFEKISYGNLKAGFHKYTGK